MIPVLDVGRTKLPVPYSLIKICKFDSYCSIGNTLGRSICVTLRCGCVEFDVVVVVVVVVVMAGVERPVGEEEDIANVGKFINGYAVPETVWDAVLLLLS